MDEGNKGRSGKERWKRASTFFTRLGDRHSPTRDISATSTDEHTLHKELETQHWLELIDGYVLRVWKILGPMSSPY